MPGPLDGVRVIDLTHVLNGPFCTMLLAQMGAQVLKIEYGAGDRFRHSWMPHDAPRDGYEFLAVNSNKQGITLNLKHKKGKEIFLDLVKKSDVVVENFSLGVMDRLGFSYEALKTVNPRIIYATTKGYGETGPYAKVRANAATIKAITGWTNVQYNFAGKGGTKVNGIGDEAAGVSLALGICSALYSREQTGQGQKVDVSMQEAHLGFMVSALHTHFEKMAVEFPPKVCSDGYYAFHLPDMTNDLWHKFVVAMGKPEQVDNPRYATQELRRAHHDELEDVISSWVKDMTRQELWTILSSIGMSSAPVLTLEEVFEDPHIQARQVFIEVEHPQAGTLKLLRPWINFSDTPSAINSPAPLQGQHNNPVYQEVLGLSQSEIDSLAAEGVI